RSKRDWSSDVCSSDLNCRNCRRSSYIRAFRRLFSKDFTGRRKMREVYDYCEGYRWIKKSVRADMSTQKEPFTVRRVGKRLRATNIAMSTTLEMYTTGIMV